MIKLVIEDVSKLPQNKLSALVSFLFAMNDIPVQLLEQPDAELLKPKQASTSGVVFVGNLPEQKTIINDQPFSGLENAYDDVMNGDQVIDLAKTFGASQKQDDQSSANPSWPFTPAAQQVKPSGIEVDSEGLPWDARIHSSSRNLNADGSWRLRRNLNPDILTQVMAELKKTMGTREVMEQVNAPLPPSVTPVAAPAPPVVISPPLPPVTGISPPVGAAPIASGGNKFPSLMKGIVAMKTAGSLKDNQVKETLDAFNIPSLPMLMHRPDVIDEVAAALGIAL